MEWINRNGREEKLWCWIMCVTSSLLWCVVSFVSEYHGLDSHTVISMLLVSAYHGLDTHTVISMPLVSAYHGLDTHTVISMPLVSAYHGLDTHTVISMPLVSAYHGLDTHFYWYGSISIVCVRLVWVAYQRKRYFYQAYVLLGRILCSPHSYY